VKEFLADPSLGYVFTHMKVDMPMHADWAASLDASNPINFCIRRVWHDMIKDSRRSPISALTAPRIRFTASVCVI